MTGLCPSVALHVPTLTVGNRNNNPVATTAQGRGTHQFMGIDQTEVYSLHDSR